MKMTDTTDSLALYIHWPFCKSKCPYCSFASIPLDDDSLYEEFERLLLCDLQKSAPYWNSRRIGSVFFGGGTPSLMRPQSIEKILKLLSPDCSMEITLEANPATFDKNKMQDFKNAGINRLSLGIQSFSQKNLKFLGRIYDENQSISAAEIVSSIFENFSFDFMYGYECQTMESLQKDLTLAANNFGCKHISCYQLTFEEGTPFYQKLLKGEIKKIDENKEIDLYNFIEDVLASHNIFRYEISNYAIPKFESHHNLSYWKYDDYLGIGPGAHSRILWNGNKYEIIKTADPFLWRTKLENNESEEMNILGEEEKLQEIILMGLRLVDGIVLEDLYAKISSTIVDEIISQHKLNFLREQNLIKNLADRIQLTRSGFLKINSIVSFLLD
ncbi:MAG: radical SAM family heme chaperone HemW [Holosporaceae bacterium]|jgi:oxygen-independent coproporphyrinogen-3 oxidase|nr:radical SAM family heme chaperone HemW [Holosporaceae bacterium]